MVAGLRICVGSSRACVNNPRGNPAAGTKEVKNVQYCP